MYSPLFNSISQNEAPKQLTSTSDHNDEWTLVVSDKTDYNHISRGEKSGEPAQGYQSHQCTVPGSLEGEALALIAAENLPLFYPEKY